MSELKVTKTEETSTTTVIRRYNVSGAEPVKKPFSTENGWRIVPEQMTVQFVGGKLDRVAFFGHRLLAGGRLGEAILMAEFPSWRVGSLPAWAKPYLSLEESA